MNVHERAGKQNFNFIIVKVNLIEKFLMQLNQMTQILPCWLFAELAEKEKIHEIFTVW